MADLKFKLFKVNEVKIVNSRELINFMNNKEAPIAPHSLSVDRYYQDHKLILLGYNEVKEPPTNGIRAWVFELKELLIEDVAYFGLANIGQEIEKALAEEYTSEQIICQDIEYQGESAVLTVLVAN